jgi:hypothetical protein
MRQDNENPTSAPELVLVAYRALSASEQEHAYGLIAEARVQRLAGEESEFGRLLRALQRVAEIVGEPPGIEDYKRVRAELRTAGEELPPPAHIQRYFNGSWHLAKEALGLADTNTPRFIEARFAKRKLGKVWRYTDATLKEAVANCVAEIGHVPQVAEFEHWRERELELAKAKGEELHMPSSTPYRRRWGTWEKALSSFGYSEDAINGRLERPC